MTATAKNLHKIVPGGFSAFEHFFQFYYGLSLDLSYSLAGHAEFLAYLVKREGLRFADSETHSDDFFLSRGKSLEHVSELFLKKAH